MGMVGSAVRMAPNAQTLKDWGQAKPPMRKRVRAPMRIWMSVTRVAMMRRFLVVGGGCVGKVLRSSMALTNPAVMAVMQSMSASVTPMKISKWKVWARNMVGIVAGCGR